jgi:uncharacterized protein (DUF1697 family)
MQRVIVLRQCRLPLGRHSSTQYASHEMSQLYIALLRGINVGGNNLVPMAGLRALFEELGATDVQTYIQSGNVVFDGGDVPAADWIVRLEAALAERFDYHARVTLRSHDQLRAIVAGAPPGFGGDPDAYRSDVVFLLGPSTAAEVVAQMRTRDGVDSMAVGDDVVYFDRLAARAGQSYLSRVVSLPIYKEMTIRNWRTTTTLLRMLDERASR